MDSFLCILNMKVTYLFASVNNVFWIDQAALARPSDHRVMPGRSVGQFIRRQLEMRFSQTYPTKQYLPRNDDQWNAFHQSLKY